ncbi:MAG: hypothetical protein ACLP3C_09640 [Mycobacterium sp.]|uniref:hypothetical protein n=1 Tax=Mycobacterium sp. TaxID=1785 RepID=UPI003F96C211
MPIYVLGALNQRVQIPNQPLAVSITGSVQGAALTVDAAAGQRVMRRNAHVAVLPQVTDPVSIKVVSQGQGPFATGTEITLAIGHGSPGDLDPVEVVFDPVDVGDRTAVELATLLPSGDSVEVAVTTLRDTALDALASAARTSARKVVGPGIRVARTAVLLALDASASMRPVFSDGTAAAVADIVVGVADALGIKDVSATLIGDDAVPVTCAGAVDLAAAVGQLAPRWCAGARWSRLPGTGALTIVCSDLPMLSLGNRFPILVVSSDPRLDAHRMRIAPPRPGTQAGDQLLADTVTLDRITSALVRALR